MALKYQPLVIVALLLATPAWAESHDLVIENGRVMDPETGFDQVANVGIDDGVITRITSKSLSGERTIDATGLVVAPGFIDAHSHAQDAFGFRLYLRDGVTTAMDLETGAYPVSAYYDYWDGRAQLNYGVSVGHMWARMAILDDVDPKGRPFYGGVINESLKDDAHWQTKNYDRADTPAILAGMERGLKAGGLGIGFPIGYYTATSSPEVMQVAALAKRHDSFITSHVRYLSQVPPSGYLGFQEMITVAQVHDVPLLLHHVPSNCLGLTTECLDLIDDARASGVNVIGEFYPYTFASTYANADYLFPGYQKKLGITGSDLVVIQTGEVLDDEKFERMRTEAPETFLLMYTIKEKDMLAAARRPGVVFGSDGVAWIMEDGSDAPADTPYGSGRGHPRGAGAHARFLRMAREDDAIGLMDALWKLSYGLADFLDDTIPQFKTRGRVQEGMTADLTIFDPETVTDNASWEEGKNTLPSTGIPYVLVNGVPVVDDSRVRDDLFPGVAIRRAVSD
ncbi:D-glutamate deacylase [Seongchinamella unica]|uniref:D-glutamate deacylase n=1 Tax=Seongchinamella unica TaxID=2547392 RepID=A0A4R5LQH0_9GAMM|nr:amidohydrolase family protein [Seongchinamella unica]TDG12798.1 D-glutamate deacylase [Seongchinamella unica]